MQVSTKEKNLKIVEVTDNAFLDAWDSFLAEYDQDSFYYQLAVIEHYEMLSKDVHNKSFVLMSNDVPLAICALFVEKVNGKFQGSLSNGGYIPAPLFYSQLSEKQHRALEEKVFNEMKHRLGELKADRLFIESNVLSVGVNNIEDQMMARFGALDISTTHHIVELGLEDEAFWKQIRHSSKSIINSGLRQYDFSVYDQSNYTHEIGRYFAKLHHKTSGRITRDISTFDEMNSWIKKGCALMFEQRYKGEIVQMIIVALGKGTAIGASAADDPEIEIPVPLTHSMNYFIYQEIKRRGGHYFDVGETAFRSTLFKQFSKKELAIHYFKRGFGERSYPLKKWVWFSTLSEELLYLDERLNNYKNFIAKAEG